MIERMKKIMLLGSENTRDTLLGALQNAGVVQIEPYSGGTAAAQGDAAESERLLDTIKTLKRFLAEHPDADTTGVGVSADPRTAAKELEQLLQRLSTLDDQRQMLMNEKTNLEDWGRFRLSDIDRIASVSGSAIQFWEIPAKLMDSVDFTEAAGYIEIRHTPMRHYVVTFADKPLKLENCLEERFARDIHEVDELLRANFDEREQAVSRILAHGAVMTQLTRLYFESVDSLNFARAQYAAAFPVEKVYALQGFAPGRKLAVVDALAREAGVVMMEISPDEGERIPTQLENRGVPAVGEQLVSFYDTPSYEDWDPSAVIFLSFLVFFSMIMGDGGYGLVLFAITLFARLKVKKPSVSLRRFFYLAFALSLGTVAYGVASGSFFGVTDANPALGWILEYKLFNGGGTDSETLSTMMRISILVGMTHISISLILKTLRLLFRFRSVMPSLANVAWIVAIWTFFFWWGEPFMGVPSKHPLQVNILIGCLAAVFVSGAAVSLNPLKMFLGGFLGVYNGVQFFSDVLSYIRIFALGLSGALISATFNSMAGGIADIGPAFIVPGILIAIVGHALNVGLCIMSAVIHGLRLNYLEYYRWSFDGGGRAFKPFRSLLNNN
jgi:V/A-type H+/Na+-transporting ATPase subunit I